MANRLIKIINLSIAVFLVAAVGAAYWFAWRPIPQTSGELSLPVSAGATVVRDRLGIPHITAKSWEDAIVLQGYATAQDRLWQMDALRRLAAGELAEIVGPAALESDRDSRRLRLRRLAEQHVKTLPAADRAVLAAYARGVNAFIETHRSNLPIEFTLLGYQPRPWSMTDSMLAALQMYRTLTNSWKHDRVKSLMLAGGDKEKVNALFPPRTGLEAAPGSNAWAISGSLTASGKPLLANDPHLDYGLPSTWHQVHLKADGLNVIGVALPGVPCVIIGHNEHIAWGVTNLQFDVQDLYREKIDLRSGRYEFRGQVEQAAIEQELIPVKGGRTELFTGMVTRHGPVMINENGEVLTLRWAGADPNTFQFPFLDINRAANWQEFTAALARYPGPGQNFVYADSSGNIGYHATGRLPIRKGFTGAEPLDGASGEQEWSGYMKFEELPAFYNPPAGLIVTANQNPFPADFPYPVNGDFAPYYRSHQIHDMLAAHKGWKPADLVTVQKDVYSGFSHFLSQQVVAAWDKRKATNPKLQPAIDLLRNWNGQMEKGAAQPMIVALTYQRLRRSLVERAAPRASNLYDYPMSTAVIEKLLRQRPAGWFPDWDQTLLKCLQDGIEEGAQSQGSNVQGWDYGLYNQISIPNRVVEQLPLIGKYFNIGPVPMSGSQTTVKQMTRKLGPSMRFAADTSAWDNSLNNITIGESGHILSSHYRDQWDAYYGGTSLPMQFTNVEAKATLRVRPQ